MLRRAHVEVKHRIARPFLFQPFHRQPFEQFLTSLEVAAQRTGQQGFSKTAGTAQELIFRGGMGHSVDQFRLVYIQVIPLPDFREGLDAYRI